MPGSPSLTAVYQQDGPWIVAWIVEIPGVMTQGATLEEARANLFDALQLTLELRREQASPDQTDRPVVHREAIPFSLPAWSAERCSGISGDAALKHRPPLVRR